MNISFTATKSVIVWIILIWDMAWKNIIELAIVTRNENYQEISCLYKRITSQLELVWDVILKW